MKIVFKNYLQNLLVFVKIACYNKGHVVLENIEFFNDVSKDMIISSPKMRLEFQWIDEIMVFKKREKPDVIKNENITHNI